MSRIKIKNFGPIKVGNPINDGWIDIKKVTVFIGNQGSGKSTVAKLISSFMWLEKALIRGDINPPILFCNLIKFHRLENYLQPDTQIEYEGNCYRLTLSDNSTERTIKATELNKNSIRQPKIMYVPAERNFLSSITNINKVSDLIIGSLKSYSVEFRNAQLAYKNEPIELPINNTKITYDSEEDENYLMFNGKKLKLSEASSGFHSFVPLYWVTKYSIEYLKQKEEKLLTLLSTDQTIRRNNELQELNTQELDEETLRKKVTKINEKYISKYFVNIIEEPEQNLYPNSQRELLNSLLAFNNTDNLLIMTTHSPYLINYISLAVKADELKEKTTCKELRNELNSIVPITSTINPKELVIYELDETDGSVNKLDDFEGIPSDQNFLNSFLKQTNKLFDALLEIEENL